jgi:hypothetical protein
MRGMGGFSMPGVGSEGFNFSTEINQFRVKSCKIG